MRLGERDEGEDWGKARYGKVLAAPPLPISAQRENEPGREENQSALDKMSGVERRRQYVAEHRAAAIAQALSRIYASTPSFPEPMASR